MAPQRRQTAVGDSSGRCRTPSAAPPPPAATAAAAASRRSTAASIDWLRTTAVVLTAGGTRLENVDITSKAGKRGSIEGPLIATATAMMVVLTLVLLSDDLQQITSNALPNR